MRKFKRTAIWGLCVSLVFVLGMMTPVSSVEMDKSKAKTEIPKITEAVPCPAMAAVTGCTVLEASGGTVGFARLKLSWTFGTGQKPNKLFITVYRREGTPADWNNIMPSSAPFEVKPSTKTSTDVKIFRLFSGDYKIVFTAHYSCSRVKEYTFFRHI
jgi:hypothetical protein